MAMEVVVGTYEELILSYKLVPTEKGYEFELSFTDHSHTGCIRSLATSHRGILASGSSDEVIRLFNIKKRIEIGSLMHHTGIITSLTFYGKIHMFSTSEDGTIGIWKVGKWECLRTLRGHKGAVNSLSVHPSGKMALSVGRDKALRIWNLMTGKCAYVTHVRQAADQILWSPDGSSYLVIVNNTVDIYDVETAKVTDTMEMMTRINTAQFLKGNAVILGGEEGKLLIYDIKLKKILLEHSTNTTRVKGLCWCEDPEDAECMLLVTASSDGFIKVWRLKQLQDDSYSITTLGEIQTKFRVTCATLFCHNEMTNQSRKHTPPADTSMNMEESTKDSEDESTEEEETPSPETKKAPKEVKFTVHENPTKKLKTKKKKVEVSISVDSKNVTKHLEEATTNKLKKKLKVKRLKQKS